MAKLTEKEVEKRLKKLAYEIPRYYGAERFEEGAAILAFNAYKLGLKHGKKAVNDEC